MELKRWMQFPGVMCLMITVTVGWPFLTPAPYVIGPLWWAFLLWRIIAKIRKMRA